MNNGEKKRGQSKKRLWKIAAVNCLILVVFGDRQSFIDNFCKHPERFFKHPDNFCSLPERDFFVWPPFTRFTGVKEAY
jgi:hypothetical protein